MKIHRTDEDTVVLEEIDGFIYELIERIPASADPKGNAAAEARLFPSPTEGRETEADADWREYVEPELRELFRDAVTVVKNDLKAAPVEEGQSHHTLHLPVKNLEAWIHALNQARLALTAEYGFTEQDLDREFPTEGGARGFILFQVHFYGVLQEFFLRQLD
jgi:hypothetical protein